MSRGGNTSTPRVVPSKRWCFTLNNYSKEQIRTLKGCLTDLKCLYIIGKEVGEKGTKHLQGYLESPMKIRPVEKFKMKEIHWEKCRGTRDDNIKYCSKDGNYFSNFMIPKDPLIGKKMYKWQKKVLKIIKGEPDDRIIYWFWEPVGCSGKTALAKHICMNYDAIYISGSAKDIKYALQDRIPRICIFDFPRISEDYVSYSALEEVKNGIFFSNKYESKMVIGANPFVICLANFSPDESMLSKDRWRVKRLHT